MKKIRRPVGEARSIPRDTAIEAMMSARHDGSLTRERYAELLKKGLAEIDAFIDSLPERDRWLRHDLEADLRAYDPDS